MRSGGGGSTLATIMGVALIVVAALLLYEAIRGAAVPPPEALQVPVADGAARPLPPSSAAAQQGLAPAAPGPSAPVPPGSTAAPPASSAAPAAPAGTTPASAVAPSSASAIPAAPAPAPPPPSGLVARSVIWSALRAAGYSQVQAAGVMGNMQNESAFDVETNWPDVNGYHAYGLISWNAAFYPNAPSLVTGNKWADLAQQVQYLLQHTRRVAKGLEGATPAEVAGNWSNYVEACAGCAFGGYQNGLRQANALFIYQEAISGGWG